MSNPGEGSQNPPEPPMDIEDPRLVDVIVEDLKSQGVFDKIRAECIGEVDTKVRKCHLDCRVLRIKKKGRYNTS